MPTFRFTWRRSLASIALALWLFTAFIAAAHAACGLGHDAAGGRLGASASAQALPHDADDGDCDAAFASPAALERPKPATLDAARDRVGLMAVAWHDSPTERSAPALSRWERPRAPPGALLNTRFVRLRL